MNGNSPIIIDNTNLRVWEFKPYILMVILFNFICRAIEIVKFIMQGKSVKTD
jgi:hypothetical protein